MLTFMQKVFAWLLLTFRWILVVSLPLIWLIVGFLLMPGPRPVWERKLIEPSSCAGIIADETTTALVVMSSAFQDMGVYYRVIHGLDIPTGQELYSTRLAGQKRCQLVSGTTYAIGQVNFFDPSLVIFDWRSNIELASLNSRIFVSSSTGFTYRNHVLAELKDVGSDERLSFWHTNNEEVRAATFPIKELFSDYRVQLSPVGNWAVVSYSFLDETVPTAPRFVQRVQLIDTNTGKVAQNLPSDIQLVRWHSEQPGFLALRRDENKGTQYWMHYHYEQEGGFIADLESRPVASQTKQVKQTSSPFIVLGSLSTEDPWRIKLSALMGSTGRPFIDRYWPLFTKLSLCDPITGNVEKSLIVPDIDLLKDHVTIHPDPSGQGLILEQPGHLAYWEFNPGGRWYPWLGLCIGIIFSVLVARWIKVRPKPVIVDSMAVRSTTGLNS